MTAGTIAVSAGTTGCAISHAPDWGSIPFEVGCARCGYDLRGLEEPRCPTCHLDFDWSETVPLEKLTCLHCGYHLQGLPDMRCPECGERFAWEDVLMDYRRRQKPLFEYQWRSRPVLSFFRTWLLAVRPWKLWTTLDLHDPPQLGPLFATVAAGLGGMTILSPVLEGAWTWLYRRSWARPPGRAALLQQIVDNVADPSSYFFLRVVISFLLASLLGLLVFRQSMRRYNVRNVHVFRVWAYALSPMLPLIPVAMFGWFYLCLVFKGAWAYSAEFYLPTLWLLYTAWSIQLAYQHYLRIPHSGAVAVTAQLMALLGASVFCDIIASAPSLMGYLPWLLSVFYIL